MKSIIKKDIVYLHGLLGNQNEFSEIYQALDQSYAEHHALNLKTPHEQENFIDYVKRLHEEISANCKTGNIHLVGFSLGGRLAFYLKYLFPMSYKKIIIISSQVVSQEEFEQRRDEDKKRLNGINSEEMFKKWIESFYKMSIYGKFSKSKNYKKKVEEIEYQKLNHYKRLFKNLSVTNQPRIKTDEIIWDTDLVFINGLDDIKYTKLFKVYQRYFQGAQFLSINGAAHAVHLEKPDKVIKLIKALI